MTFTTSLDTSSKTRTISTALLLLPLIWINFSTSGLGLIVTLFLISTFGAIFLYMYALKPNGYEITNDSIIVHRWSGKVVIPKSRIKHLAEFGYDTLRNINGGVFGYVGKRTTDWGSYTFYATRRDNAVLITTLDDENIIVTPDEPERFVLAFGK